jgi:flagellar export protein FliJ
MRAEELAQWNDLMDRMTDSVHRASEAAAEARRLFQEKQRQAQDAARETRKLEVLEQRVAERERKVETMRNQRELDDIAGRRFQARRKEQDGPSSD